MRYLLLAVALLAFFKVSTGYYFTNEIIHLNQIVGVSGSGTTTRYWDCCKPSCAWSANLKNNLSTPVQSCAANGDSPIDKETPSACVGGTLARSYMCSNQAPIVVNDTFAMGFVAASFTGGVDTNNCCACVLLSFGGALQGKQMAVQVTNTGSDLGANHFDIAIPGGGVGIFTQGCSTQWGTPANGWGDQYGGVGSEADCSQLPTQLQSGCRFRFQWMENASNPPVTFDEIACPSQLTGITGCTG